MLTGSEGTESRTRDDAMLSEKLVCVVTAAFWEQVLKPLGSLQWGKFQALLQGSVEGRKQFLSPSQPNMTTNQALEVDASSAYPHL